jgi:hypothetical protein
MAKLTLSRQYDYFNGGNYREYQTDGGFIVRTSAIVVIAIEKMYN